MFCTNCGKEIKDGSAFCTNCGARIAAPIPKKEKTVEEEVVQEQPAAVQDRTKFETQTEQPVQDRTENVELSQTQSEEPEPAADPKISETRETDAIEKVRQIIGKRTDYYLTQFGQMQQGAKSKINWASFFFSLWHASYRNMWREWLHAVRLPLIIGICLWVLSGILMFVQPAVGIVLILAALAVGVWQIDAQILFAKRFNGLYMQHVEKKLAQNDCSSDPSGIRVVVAYLISMGISAIVGTILSVAMFGGMLTALGGLDDTYYEDIPPEDAIVEPDISQSPETENTTEPSAAAVNLNDYVGSWMVDRYNSYMDGYVGFFIENNNDQFYFSANGVWNQGDRVNSIEYTLLELNYEGTQAGGYYVDGRGNIGDVILDFEDGELYLTITAEGSGDYSFSMEHEHCTRDDIAEESEVYEPEIAQEQQAYQFYYDSHTYSNGMNSLSGYTIGDAHLWPTDTLTITDGDLNELTRIEVAAIRNEIFARHGYTFSSQEWADFFATANWYVPDAAFSNDMLNTTEKQNVETITAYEQARGWNQ